MMKSIQNYLHCEWWEVFCIISIESDEKYPVLFTSIGMKSILYKLNWEWWEVFCIIYIESDEKYPILLTLRVMRSILRTRWPCRVWWVLAGCCTHRSGTQSAGRSTPKQEGYFICSKKMKNQDERLDQKFPKFKTF